MLFLYSITRIDGEITSGTPDIVGDRTAGRRFRWTPSVNRVSYHPRQSGTTSGALSKLLRSQPMTEQHRIELAFSRPRFAALIGTAVITGFGLLAAGLFAGIEVGAVEAKAAIPRAIDDTPLPLPLQYPHQSPVLEPLDRQSADRQYMVQAASFRDKDQAGNLVADLMRHGYSAAIIGSTDQTGRNWLIVRVGPYAARAEASRAANELGHFARSEPIVRAAEN